MSEMSQSTGKRKTSIARVILTPGDGKVVVNRKRTLEQHFPREAHQKAVLSPLVLTERLGSYDVKVTVSGGGITGQAHAIRHGIARSLAELETDLRASLKKAGLLTRDARIVESKKYGHHKARRSPQFSKR
jgi:small subunit ribosomal protein S9